jgi:hypothetical protein
MALWKSKRYKGAIGLAKWAKDKLFSINNFYEVKKIYVDGKNLYKNLIMRLVKTISEKVDETLKETKQDIVKAREEIQIYIDDTLPESLKKIAKESADKVLKQFDELYADVEDRKSALADQLVSRYKEANEAIDKRIAAMKEENRGLVTKFKEKLQGVIEVYKNFKKRLGKLLGEAKGVIGKILDDPIGFLKNLLKGLKKGFSQFLTNIWHHLKKGLLGWVFGSLSSIGIKVPEEFTLKSIIGLVFQIVGITYDRIRAKVVKLVGERNVALLEKVWAYVSTLIKNGPAGLWAQMKEEAVNLKNLVIEKIKNWVITKIITNAVIKLGTMFNPVGAIIQAVMTIYDTIMFFVTRINQIMDLVQSIIRSLGAIVEGRIEAAANRVEQTLGLTLPVIISFLARLLRLGGITKAIGRIIKKVKKRVNKVIDKVLSKIVKGIKKLFGKGLKTVRSGAAKSISWFKIKVAFKTKNGKSHILDIEGSEKKPRLMIRSTPQEFQKFIKIFDKADDHKKKLAEKGFYAYKEWRKAVGINIKKAKITEEEKAKRVKASMNKIREISSLLLFDNEEIDLPKYIKGKNVFYENVNIKGVGEKMTAFVLSKKGKKGSKPSVENKTYKTLFKRKKGNGTYYVRGHLLNENIHGPGNYFPNLTPLSVKGNDEHKRRIENVLKTITRLGGVVSYIVDPIYKNRGLQTDDSKRPERFTDEEWEDIKEIREVENIAVPTHLNVEAFLLEKDETEKFKFKEKKKIYIGKIPNFIETDKLEDYNVTKHGIKKKKFLLKDKMDKCQEIENLNGITADGAKAICTKLKNGEPIKRYKNLIGITKKELDKKIPQYKIIGAL